MDDRTRSDDDPNGARVDDLRATGDSIRRRLRRLDAIETEKGELPADDARVDQLSDEAVEEADRIAAETRAERALSDELG